MVFVLALLCSQTPGTPQGGASDYLDLETLAQRYDLVLTSDAATGREVLRAKDLTVILAPALRTILFNGTPRKLESPVVVESGRVRIPREVEVWLGGIVPLRKTEVVHPSSKKPKWFSIVIDPGHGGRHTGCRGRSGVFEKELTLDIALRLKPFLDEAGGNVLLTRTDDRHFDLEVDRDLQHRVQVVNRTAPDLFLSIHVNYVDRPEPRGFEIWMRRNDRSSRDLAQHVRAALKGELRTEDRGIVNDYRGLRVLKGTSCPAVLIEVGFISNPVEERQLCDPSYRQRVASAIARGVEKYLASRK